MRCSRRSPSASNINVGLTSAAATASVVILRVNQPPLWSLSNCIRSASSAQLERERDGCTRERLASVSPAAHCTSVPLVAGRRPRAGARGGMLSCARRSAENLLDARSAAMLQHLPLLRD